MAVATGDAVRWVERSAEVMVAEREYLTKLDSAIGDADHGANMSRGFRAAVEKLSAGPPAEPAAVFKSVGMTLLSKVGGAGGPLYGSFFMKLAEPVGGIEELGPEQWAAALRAGVDGVRARGKAELGDKTMVDALMPAVEALETAVAEGASLSAALERSAAAAEQGARATVPLVARKGRASYLGERSAGHQDPGATSSHLLLKAAAETWG